MDAALKRFLIVAAAIAAVVLALVVLVGHPTDPQDLLAGGVMAAGIGLLLSVLP